MKRTISDAALIAASVLGAGFVSGTETVAYLGGGAGNAVVFCAVFALCLHVALQCVKKFDVSDAEQLNAVLFGKFSPIADVVLTCCYFVNVSTMLAASEQCLRTFCEVNTNLPLFGFVTAVVAALVLKTNNGVRLLGCVSAPLIACYVVFCMFTPTANVREIAYVPAYLPIVYALCNGVFALGVLPKTNSRPKVAIFAAVSVAALAVAVNFAVARRPDGAMPLLAQNTAFGKIFGCVAMFSAILTGIAACALPIAESVDKVVEDKTLSIICVLAFALATSMFGFDIIVRYGYLLIAAFGGAVTIAAIVKLCKASKLNAATATQKALQVRRKRTVRKD